MPASRPTQYSCFIDAWVRRRRVGNYEENSESVELWSPGNPFFTAPDLLPAADDVPVGATLKDLLEQ